MQIFLKAELIFWLTIFISMIPLFFIYRFWFFLRNPERKIPPGNNIVAPADGNILYIKEIKNNEVPISIKNNKKIKMVELMEDAEENYNLVIGIFMSPFSVHQNRIPFDCKIIKNYYKNSTQNKSMVTTFLNLIFNIKPFTENAEYITDNERNTLTIKNDIIKGAIVQIASTWVDNIINIDMKPGDIFKKGERFGMIRMGSQCDLYLNIKSKYEIIVKEKEYVKAGKSILIELKN